MKRLRKVWAVLTWPDAVVMHRADVNLILFRAYPQITGSSWRGTCSGCGAITLEGGPIKHFDSCIAMVVERDAAILNGSAE